MTVDAAVRDDSGVRRVEVLAFTVPTDRPEADGTLAWSETTMVLVRLEAGGRTGLGYSYGPVAAAHFAAERLAPLVTGKDAMRSGAIHCDLLRAVRNDGRVGIASAAASAADNALWDLRARLLETPMVRLLGTVRDAVPVYGSGGFTSYSVSEIRSQIEDWSAQGVGAFKIKVGRSDGDDRARVRAARKAAGDSAVLMVDANGAYGRKHALRQARVFDEEGVRWFEEPVSSDDLEGLRLLRDFAPPGMEIAAGEYGYDSPYFQRMLAAGAVDVLQADATRCAGVTGLLAAGALSEAHHTPLSAHTAPNLHVHPCCAIPAVRHVEYFHDHVRIEGLLFDGVLRIEDGNLRPRLSDPGFGLALKEQDAEPYIRFRFAAEAPS